MLVFFKELFEPLVKIWTPLKQQQKLGALIVATLLIGILLFFNFNSSNSDYIPLYSENRLLLSDVVEVESYLDSKKIKYQSNGETGIMVPKENLHQIRMDLAAMGIPKTDTSKGFELFDSSTWIKGEKELQILEMRALKGEIERDISEYENIKSAQVTLDIAPPRSFSGMIHKTKASIILTLMPGARLSTSQLRAITYHISGSVRGLEPNMVAISDTSGKLYQAMDSDGSLDMLRSAEVTVEERLKSKIDGMLAMIIGRENFYSTVQVVMSRKKISQETTVFSDATPVENTSSEDSGLANTALTRISRAFDQIEPQKKSPVEHLKMKTIPGKIESISIGVMIDKTIALEASSDIPENERINGLRNSELLKEEIESQLSKILEGYSVISQPAVDFVEFNKKKPPQIFKKEAPKTNISLFVLVGIASFAVLFVMWMVVRFWKKERLDEKVIPKENSATFEQMLKEINVRFQNDPQEVVTILKDWLKEDQIESFESKK